ncbi:MAG TPA: pepsin-like aspartyl protease, partial [Kofleriaceae bacterium]|nr:pepsin-like aspartyl protease [Kofleriaceae bacterium]
IFGLGPAALLDPNTDTTAYFDVLTQQKHVPATMAFELCPTDGTMWLGGYDTTHAASAMQYTPLLVNGVNADFYSINMTAMAVAGSDLGITAATFDNPIVDTGTSLFYIPTTAETALLAKINADAGKKTLFTKAFSESGTGCIAAKAGTTAAMVDATLPKMEMTFDKMGGGSFTLEVPAMQSYLYDGGGGQFCLAIFGGGDQGEATMGDTFMRAFVTVIDIANNKVGFAPSSHCVAPGIPTKGHVVRERGHGPHHVRRAH